VSVLFSGEKVVNFAALKIKDFRNLWIADVISEFGNVFYRWMFIYVIDQLTHSALMVSIAGIVGTLPFLVFSPFAGIFADRYDRKKVMLFSDISSAVILACLGLGLVLFVNLPVWLLLSCEFVLSTLLVFFMPANGAARPMLVPAEHLNEANGLCSATRSMMPLIGMALAGGGVSLIQAIFPDLYFATSVFINAATFVGSAIFVAKLPDLKVQKSVAQDSAEEKPSSYQDFKDGVRYIRGRKVLRTFFTVELISYLSVSFYITAYIIVNREWFGGQFWTLAVLECVQAVAMGAGSLYVAKMRFTRPALPYLWSTFIVAIGLIGMGLWQEFWPFALINGILGAALPFLMVPLETYIQTSTPNEYLGRVSGVQSMMTMGVLPIGMIFSVPLLEEFGPAVTFMIMGIARIFAGSLGLFNRDFRNEKMPIVEGITSGG
jgi:DHA3 family macrolide efflux protein-like MFS transporter